MNPQAKSAESFAGAWPDQRKTGAVALEGRAALLSAKWVAPALAAAVVVAIGLLLAATLNIWIDEAYTVHTTGSGLAYALGQANSFELQPPLYFSLISIWRLSNENSVAFARFPSIVFAAAAAAIIVIAARRLAPRIPSLAVALATGLNPIVIWAAVEMRIYALVLLIAAALTLALVDGFLAPAPSRAAQISYALAGAAGLYTQYYVGFLLLAFAIALVIYRRHMLPAFVIANTAIALAFLPFVPVAFQQFRSANGGDIRQVSLWHGLHEMLNASFLYVLPHGIEWSGRVKILGFLVAAALFAALVFFGRPRWNRTALAITSTWALSVLIFSAVFALAGEVPDIRRHAIAIAPLALLSALGLLSALTAHRRTLLVATAVTYVVFAAGWYSWNYRPPLSKTGDWQRVATLVSSAAAQPPVIIFPANLALPLGHYLPPRTRLVPFPNPMTFSADYLEKMTLHSDTQVARAFEADNLRSTPFWIVSDNSCDPGPQVYDFSCGYLTAYLEKHYVATRRYLFHGAIAILYERSASPPDGSR